MEQILRHPFLLIAGYWIFSALVGGMPEPDASSGKGYIWLFGSLHILSGNLTKAAAARYPQIVAQQTTMSQTTITPK